MSASRFPLPPPPVPNPQSLPSPLSISKISEPSPLDKRMESCNLSPPQRRNFGRLVSAARAHVRMKCPDGGFSAPDVILARATQVGLQTSRTTDLAHAAVPARSSMIGCRAQCKGWQARQVPGLTQARLTPTPSRGDTGEWLIASRASLRRAVGTLQACQTRALNKA